MKTPDTVTDKNVGCKTPEEIKADAATCLTRPQKSECNRFALYKECAGDCRYVIKELYGLVLQLESSLAQAERKRDAAVHDLENSAPCFACYHFIRNNGACKGGMRCCDEQFKASIGISEYDGPEWKWRGVCPENTKED